MDEVQQCRWGRLLEYGEHVGPQAAHRRVGQDRCAADDAGMRVGRVCHRRGSRDVYRVEIDYLDAAASRFEGQTNAAILIGQRLPADLQFHPVLGHGPQDCVLVAGCPDRHVIDLPLADPAQGIGAHPTSPVHDRCPQNTGQHRVFGGRPRVLQTGLREAADEVGDRLIGGGDAGHGCRPRDDQHLVGVIALAVALPQRIGLVPAAHVRIDDRHERQRLARAAADRQEEVGIRGVQAGVQRVLGKGGQRRPGVVGVVHDSADLALIDRM